jgi:hypothetical protein
MKSPSGTCRGRIIRHFVASATAGAPAIPAIMRSGPTPKWRESAPSRLATTHNPQLCITALMRCTA